jgi:hypothetical protein
MTMILARFESKKWQKKIENLGFIELDDDEKGTLMVKKIG